MDIYTHVHLDVLRSAADRIWRPGDESEAGVVVTIVTKGPFCDRNGPLSWAAALMYQHKSTAGDRKIADGLDKLLRWLRPGGDSDHAVETGHWVRGR
jgi:hypothetical protein